VKPEELESIAYREPFRPFSVRLRSGERIEIKRTLRTSVSTDRVFFSVDEDPETGVAKRMRIVPLVEIDSVEVS
jgi:hypothetical protein